jgi:hypothetical protein
LGLCCRCRRLLLPVREHSIYKWLRFVLVQIWECLALILRVVAYTLIQRFEFVRRVVEIRLELPGLRLRLRGSALRDAEHTTKHGILKRPRYRFWIFGIEPIRKDRSRSPDAHTGSNALRQRKHASLVENPPTDPLDHGFLYRGAGALV